MSRVGKNPIIIPNGVSINVNKDNMVTISGGLGTLTRTIDSKIKIEVVNNQILLTNIGKDKDSKAKHGLSRQLLNNMVIGVSEGFKKKLNVNGVGFKITQNGPDLILNIGFSHSVEVKAIEGIKLSIEGKNIIVVSGIDKEKVGQFAFYIKSIRPVEPYHAYGISYVGEVIIRKEVKSGKK